MGMTRKKSDSLFLTKIFLDLFGYFLSVGPVIVTWAATIALSYEAIKQNIFWPIFPLLPIFTTSVFLLIVFLVRLIIPRLEAGKYEVGFNRGIISWYANMALNRASKISGIRPLLHSFYITRFLLYRALGARVGFGSNTSIEFVLVDVPLITIGKNCVIGEGVHISCHYFLGSILILRPVTIGDDVFISSHCIIGPGSEIGSGSWIGYGNAIGGEKLEPNTQLKNFAWSLGGPTQPKPDYLKPLFESKNKDT